MLDALGNKIPRLENGRMGTVDLTNQQIGKFRVLDRIEGKKYFGYAIWRVQCECGAIEEKASQLLKKSTNAKYGCKECIGNLGRPRLENNQSYINVIWHHTKRSALDRGISFDLTKEQVRSVIVRCCQYCGVAPNSRIVRNLAGSFAYNGIDRVDNLKGYEIDNVAPCCSKCNMAKGEMTVGEFKAWIDRTYRYLFK